MGILGCFLPAAAASPLKIPIRIGAFSAPDVADPTFTGRAVLSASNPDFCLLTQTYDRFGRALPGTITDNFVQGGWNGFVDYHIIKPNGRTPDGRWFCDVACDASDIDGLGYAGGGTPCRLFVPAPPIVRHHWSVYQNNTKLAFGSFVGVPNMRFYVDGGLMFPSFTGGPQSQSKKK